MLRRIAIASVIFTAACAGQQKAAKPGAPTTVQEKMRITNQPYFDVASCHPQALTLPQPPNENILVGAMVSTRSQLMECLVDPKSRGPAATTKVSVKTHITDAEATHTVTGENLTPQGQKCIQDLVNKAVPIQPLATKGAKPVDSEAQFIHEQNNSPSVSFGVNEGSDFSGQIRLAQEQWCDCYAGYTTQVPPILVSHITLKKASPTAADITFDPSGSTEGDQLAACLKSKMATLPAKVSSEQLGFPHRFIHFNAQAADPGTTLPPDMRFLQLELMRGQRAAATAISGGARDNAAAEFAPLAEKYNQNRKKNYDLVPKILEKCSVLLKSSGDWIAALEAQQTSDQQMVTLVQELKAKDEAWKEVEAKLQQEFDTTQKDLANAQKIHDQDVKACPAQKK